MWIITRDLISDGKDDPTRATGIGQYPQDSKPLEDEALGLLYKFRLLDDDMNVYYLGRYDAKALDDEEAYGGLYQCELWGASYAGACHVQVKLEDYIKLIYAGKGYPAHMADFYEEQRAKSKDGWYIPFG